MVNGSPKVTVVMPTTYRRAKWLRWSLASVLRQKLDDANLSRARILVLNNDKYTDMVDAAISEAVNCIGKGSWELQVVHRDPPLYPVYSWYEGIREFTEEGEIVIFQGDDDLMVPGAVAMRVKMIDQGDWDLLVSSAWSGLVFFERPGDSECRALLPRGSDKLPEPVWEDPRPLRATHLSKVSGIFINNHTYRHTPFWWEAYQRTLALMDCIPVKDADKFAMLPEFFLLPFVDAGRAAYVDTCTCCRGEAAEALLQSGVGQISWRKPGFYAASCLCVLDGPLRDRQELEPFRQNYRRMAQRWFVRSCGMPNFHHTLRGCGGVRSLASGGGIVQLGLGVFDMARSVVGANGLKLRRRVASEPGVSFESLFGPD